MSPTDLLGRFTKFHVRWWGLLAAAGFLAAVGTVAGFFGRFAWWLDIAAHFRVQYLLLLLLNAGLLIMMKRHRHAAAYGVLALANLAVIAPFYLPGDESMAARSAHFRVLQFNVNTFAGNPAGAVAIIREYAPDLIVLEEVNKHWMDELAVLRDLYPYQTADAREDNFGIALLSRYPPERSQVVSIGPADVPSIVARIPLDGHILTLVGTHPLPPGSAAYSVFRNGQLDELAATARDMKGPLLLLGDLNISPWSWHFRQFLKKSGLHDSAAGHGIQPTWPAFAWPFGIPIDHVLHSPDVVILKRAVGRNVGSDHLPVVVDFAFRK